MTNHEGSSITPSNNPEDALRSMVSKWVLSSKELGYQSPYSDGDKFLSKMDLVAEDGTAITLHKPNRGYGQEIMTDDMGYKGSAIATIIGEGVKSALHVTTDYIAVLSSKDGELLEPKIGSDVFLKLVLDATVQKPE